MVGHINSMYLSECFPLNHLCRIRDYISNNTGNYTKHFLDCIYAFLSNYIKADKRKKENDRLFLVLPFLNK